EPARAATAGTPGFFRCCPNPADTRCSTSTSWARCGKRAEPVGRMPSPVRRAMRAPKRRRDRRWPPEAADLLRWTAPLDRYLDSAGPPLRTRSTMAADHRAGVALSGGRRVHPADDHLGTWGCIPEP